MAPQTSMIIVVKPVIAVIGGAGVQACAVVKGLAKGNNYDIKVLTRSASQPAAVELASLPRVTIVEGNCYDESTLFKVFTGANSTYVNTNGTVIGPRNETYWGIRIFEIARACGVSHFQWASLPYASKIGNYDRKFQCGHMDGKGRVAEFIKSQPTSPMKWSILSTVMYLETLQDVFYPRPSKDDPDVFVFASPMGKYRQPLIYVEDIGLYAKWMFENPDRSTGLDLQVATENVRWSDIASAFTRVTGKKAVYEAVTLDEALDMTPNNDRYIGKDFDPSDPSLLTIKQSFTGMWNTMISESILPSLDYAILDEILPTRVKSTEEWMRVVGYSPEHKKVLQEVWHQKPV